ncbi:MAG: hypothetical protein IPG75_14865 [Gemmatimonadetes bacterium]|nr:hypothetical protein [Gemmatimonadota bacterium]
MSFERLGLVMQPRRQDAALLPHRIDGNSRCYCVPLHDSGAHIWDLLLPDLRNWGGHDGPAGPARWWWDANKVGLSPPLTETPEGWLMIYHGVRQTASGLSWRGLALLDRERPDEVLLRGDMWVFIGTRDPLRTRGDVRQRRLSPRLHRRVRAATPLFLYWRGRQLHRAGHREHRSLLRWPDEHGAPRSAPSHAATRPPKPSSPPGGAAHHRPPAAQGPGLPAGNGRRQPGPRLHPAASPRCPPSSRDSPASGTAARFRGAARSRQSMTCHVIPNGREGLANPAALARALP